MELQSKNNIKEYLGNHEILDLLINNIKKNTLQNSIILYGSEGIGKSTLVYYIANKFLNNNDSHNKYFVKNDLENNKNLLHPNFFIISPIYDNEKNKFKSEITIDQIRDLTKYINLTNTNNLPKIILIDSADLLNINASNALLKILEEPSKNLYFFLISKQISLLLPTIRSRCIKFKLNNPNFENFKKILNIENYVISDSELYKLYYLTNSSPGFAMNLIDRDFSKIENEIITLFLNKELFNDNLIKFSNSVYNDSKSFELFIYFTKFLLINIMKLHYGIIENNDKSFLENFDNIYKLIPINNIFNMLEYLNNKEKLINTFNLDKRLFVLNLFSKLHLKV